MTTTCRDFTTEVSVELAIIDFMKSILCICFCLFWSLTQANMPSLAVSDLESRGLSKDEALIISDRLRQEIQSTGKFRIMERSMMSAILQEQGFQQTGACDSASCQMQMGKLLGVDQILIGSVGKLGSTFSLNIRILSVETGEILQSYSEDIRGEIDDLIRTPVKNIAKKLAQASGGQSIPVVQDNSKTSPARFWTRIGLGVGTGLALGYAIYQDSKVSQANKDLLKLRDDYSSATAGTTNWQFFRDEDDRLTQQGQDASTQSKIGAVLSGVMAAGLVITFVF